MVKSVARSLNAKMIWPFPSRDTRRRAAGSLSPGPALGFSRRISYIPARVPGGSGGSGHGGKGRTWRTCNGNFGCFT